MQQILCGTVEPISPEHEDVAPVRVAEGAPGVLLDYADPDASGGDLLICSQRALCSGGASPALGSSSSSTAGWSMSALAMASMVR